MTEDLAPDGQPQPLAPANSAEQAPPDGEKVSQPENSLPPLTLQELDPAMRRACENAGWPSLTPVQSLGLPYLLAGRDIMVQSRTGSGKTGCYLLPMLKALDPNRKQVQALVLAPTRELVLQIEREAATLFAESGLSACAIYGGVGYKRQLEALRAGAQLVIGTPGRIIDHLLRHSLNFDGLRTLVFDEADRMLSIGFYPDIREIARYLPKKRQTALFSATYPPHVLRLAEEFMREPAMLSLSRKEVHVADVEHLFCQVAPMDKDRALVRLLETESPSSAIIFCNTRADTHYLAGVLQGFGYQADEISADLPQKKREAILARIRQGTLRYLVATDVAARGIDIPDLSHVFLYDPPEDREGYIHRAGRTGRAGASGTVISLVDVIQKLELERIARFYKINLREIKTPDDAAVAKTVCERLRAILETRLRSRTGLEKIRADRYLPLVREILDTAEEEEKGKNMDILAMLLDDCHRLAGASPLPSSSPARPGQTAPNSAGRRRRSRRRGNSRKEQPK